MSHGPGRVREVATPDGRVLTVEVSGAATGTPVILLHGTPGSRSGPKPRAGVLYRLGVRLITYDRPGYGGSARHQGRRVADTAADVDAIANDLEIERFAVVGRSGGGPHSLACAALLGNRVTRAAVLVSVAPADARGLDWFDGMADDNVSAYAAVDGDAAMLMERLHQRAAEVARDPENLVKLLHEHMTDSDRRVVRDAGIRRQLARTYTEAVRPGANGWIDDVFALRMSWGFQLDAIRSPVLLWHGAEDTFSPVGHAHWLASRIPQAVIHVQAGTAHFGAFEILPDLLTWLIEKADRLTESSLTLPVATEPIRRQARPPPSRTHRVDV